jgi:hypothetical protein
VTAIDYDGKTVDLNPNDPVWLSAAVAEVHQTQSGTVFILTFSDNSTRLAAVAANQLRKR